MKIHKVLTACVSHSFHHLTPSPQTPSPTGPVVKPIAPAPQPPQSQPTTSTKASSSSAPDPTTVMRAQAAALAASAASLASSRGTTAEMGQQNKTGPSAKGNSGVLKAAPPPPLLKPSGQANSSQSSGVVAKTSVSMHTASTISSVCSVACRAWPAIKMSEQE